MMSRRIRVSLVVVVREHFLPNDLMEIGIATYGPGALFGGAQRRQQQRRQNRNDGNHHQQFDERECGPQLTLPR